MAGVMEKDKQCQASFKVCVKNIKGGRLSATGKLGCHENLVTLDQMNTRICFGKVLGPRNILKHSHLIF